MRHSLVFVALNGEQIEKARLVNGERKKITHALLCGPYGQMFGTEKQCRKYYSVWSNIFPLLFDKSFETDQHEITNFESTQELVMVLLKHQDELKNIALHEAAPSKNEGLFRRLLGKFVRE